MGAETFTVYKDKKGQHRWRLRAANGKIIADSGEGYINKQDCLDAIGLVRTQSPTATIKEE